MVTHKNNIRWKHQKPRARSSVRWRAALRSPKLWGFAWLACGCATIIGLAYMAWYSWWLGSEWIIQNGK